MWKILLVAVGMSLWMGPQNAVFAANAVYNPDVDLETAPKKYRDRVIRFRNILRKESTRAAKIAKAISIAKNRKSKYRRDAVSFLGEVRAVEALPILTRLTRIADVGDEALFALGEIGQKESIPVLINRMNDSNENFRGNAYRALQKITRRDFGFDYAEPLARRKQAIKQIKTWWKRNKKKFKTQTDSEEEKQMAEDNWQKYGRTYLHDLSR